jgi:ubiquinone/menaquinone biosynthesis C-methylase UbiE
MGIWERRVLPHLIEKACRSSEIKEERGRIVPRATGRVLEVGVGSGLNLAFYEAGKVSEIVGVDPSAELLTKARERASDLTMPWTLLPGSAEALPCDAASFDTVVVTYTLCSVSSVAAALAEMARVLRPSGHVLFIEHGRAPDPDVVRWQRLITPFWRRVGGGCHLDRDIRAELLSAGFALDDVAAHYGESPRWLGFTVEGSASCPS